MGNWSGQVKRGWGPQLPRGAPVGRPGSSELLRCFNPPAAAGRNSRAAPVTAKTSTGDDHRSVGDRHLARADVAPEEKSFGNLFLMSYKKSDFDKVLEIQKLICE